MTNDREGLNAYAKLKQEGYEHQRKQSKRQTKALKRFYQLAEEAWEQMYQCHQRGDGDFETAVDLMLEKLIGPASRDSAILHDPAVVRMNCQLMLTTVQAMRFGIIADDDDDAAEQSD
jgi:hypothetical protein